MKFKNFLKGVVLGGVVLSAAAMFAGCDITRDADPKSERPAGIDQTYSVVKPQAAAQTLGVLPSGLNEGWEKDVVSVKLKEDGSAYLLNDLEAYKGTWTENKTTKAADFNIAIADGEDEYAIEMVVSGAKATIKDKAGSKQLIGSDPIELGEKDDVIFENGLYVGIGSYDPVYGYSTNISAEVGSYTYKVSNNEIYSSGGSESAGVMKVERFGFAVFYTFEYDRAGETGETNYFFVEKKGEHSQEFIDTFGDLDYVIYHMENESRGLTKYYDVKATESTTTLKITQDITLNATKLFKADYSIPEEYSYTYENVNMQLNIKTNGTLLLTITGNDKYNMETSGKWYNIGQKIDQGLLIVFDNKQFFDGFLALGVSGDADITLESFLANEIISYIHATEDEHYSIGWNEAAESYILSSDDWVLADN